MSKLILFIFLLSSIFSLSAQNISVFSFKRDASDMTALITDAVSDQNGEKCALIKIRTTQQDFVFEGDMLGIAKRQQKVGEIWVYVPAKARRLTIKHPQLGVLSYTYGDPIEEATVYIMELSTGNVITTVVPLTTQTQWLVLSSEPTGANVYINDVYKGATPYQQEIPDGSYRYRLEYPLYHTNAGIFEMVGKEGKKELVFTMKPNYGKISISSQPEAGATVLLDGKPTQLTTPCEIEQVISGEHTVLLQREWYEPLSQKVTVSDEQTAYVSPTMVPTFGNVTVNAQYEAEIYVDGVYQNMGTWQGRLISGYHTFESKKENYDDGLTKVVVVAGEDKVIALSPTPKYGRLKIVSTPYNATITLNGKNYGTTPETLENLLIGSYTLELQKEGFGTLRRLVTIEENKTSMIDVALNNNVQVTFTSVPSGAFVYSGNELLGTTPLLYDFTLGNKNITIKKEGFKDIHKSLTIESDNEFSFQLEKLAFEYKVESNATKALVYVDGEYMGTTPIHLYLNKGSHTIRVGKDGYEDAHYNARIPKDYTFYATLQKIKKAKKPKEITPLGISYLYTSNSSSSAHKLRFDLYNFLFYTYQLPVNQSAVKYDVNYSITAHEIGLKFNIRMGRNIALAPTFSYIGETGIKSDHKVGYPSKIKAELGSIGCEFYVYISQRVQLFSGGYYLFDMEYIEEEGKGIEGATYDEYFSGRTGTSWLVGLRVGLGKLEKGMLW